MAVTFGVEGGAACVRGIGRVETLADGGHGVFYIWVETGGGSGEHGGAEGAGLFGSVDTNGSVHDICHHLHDERRFFCYAAEADQPFDGDAFGDEAVDDGSGAEAGGFCDGVKDPGGVGTEAKAGDRAFEQLIGVGGSAAVEPVERQWVIGGRLECGGVMAEHGDNFVDQAVGVGEQVVARGQARRLRNQA